MDAVIGHCRMDAGLADNVHVDRGIGFVGGAVAGVIQIDPELARNGDARYGRQCTAAAGDRSWVELIGGIAVSR